MTDAATIGRLLELQDVYRDAIGMKADDPRAWVGLTLATKAFAEACDAALPALLEEFEGLKADLDNAHDGRNKEANARCEAEDEIARLRAELDATRRALQEICDYGKLRLLRRL